MAWFWQGALLLVENDVLLNHLPQFLKHRINIVAMHAAQKEFRAAADVTPILVGPIDNVLIAISDFLHVG